MLINDLGVDTTEQGFIKVDPAQATNVKGVYAAGDISIGCNCMRQIVAAAAEGSIAAQSIFIGLRKKTIAEY